MPKIIDTSINYNKLINNQIEVPKIENKVHVYHYTSLEGLKGIVENCKIRFSNIAYLNDKEELITGIKSYEKVIGYKGNINELLRAIEEMSRQIYVCSFSVEKDDLNLWNYYTKSNNSQGYNIKFNYKELVKSLLKSNQCLDGCQLLYGMVNYCYKGVSTYSKKLNNNMVFWLKFIEHLLSMDENGKSSDPQVKPPIYKISKKEEEKFKVYNFNGAKVTFEDDAMAPHMGFIKNEAFKGEKEFRIAIWIPKEKLKKINHNIYKFRSCNGVLIPYIELMFVSSAINGIGLSPTTQSDFAKKGLIDFLEYCGYNGVKNKEFIFESKVPLRY